MDGICFKRRFLKILSIGDVTIEVGSEFRVGITLTAKKRFCTLFLDIEMASRKEWPRKFWLFGREKKSEIFFAEMPWTIFKQSVES